MKLLRGKNWFQIDFDKKGRNGLYIGPLFNEDKDVNGVYQFKLLSFMTRRFKLKLLKDRVDKKWEFSFCGHWCSDGTNDQYMNYSIILSKFKDVS